MICYGFIICQDFITVVLQRFQKRLTPWALLVARPLVLKTTGTIIVTKLQIELQTAVSYCYFNIVYCITVACCHQLVT